MSGLVALTQPEVARDRYGHPVINGAVYERPSSLAKALESAGGLPSWFGQRVVEGLRSQPELLKSDEDLRDLAERAAVLGGSKDGAEAGTAIHEAVEALVKHGELPEGCSPETEADAVAALDLIDRHFEVLLSEVFVVTDEIGAAGTTDLILRSRETAACYVGDIKSSGSPAGVAARYAGLAWSSQLAIYARGRVLLTEEGTVPYADLVGSDPSLERGVVIHVLRGEATATLVEVDLVAGWDHARLAKSVIAARRERLARVV